MRVIRVNPNYDSDPWPTHTYCELGYTGLDTGRVRFWHPCEFTEGHCLLTCIKKCFNGWIYGMAGKEVLGYMGPCPPVGIHRYVFVLFRQEASTIAVDPPSARNNFSTREFADRHHLGLPVAAVYFNAHKEPASRRSWVHFPCASS